MSSGLDAAIAELKTLGATPEFLKDILVNQQISTESDRSIVVLSGAYIDENLIAAIRANLIEDPKIASDLLDPGRALGDFAARNRLAYLIGLYEKNVYYELKDVASIRNDFAHKVEINSFDHETARGKIMSLRLIRSSSSSSTLTTLKSPKLGRLLDFKIGTDPAICASDAKLVFNMTVSVLIATLQSVKIRASRIGLAQT